MARYHAFLPQLDAFDYQIVQHYHAHHLRSLGFPAKWHGVVPNMPALRAIHGPDSAKIANQAIDAAQAVKTCLACNVPLTKFVCLECDGKGCTTCHPHDGFAGALVCPKCYSLHI